MIEADLADAALRLIRGRARALGEPYDALAKQYAGVKSQQLAEVLSTAPRAQKVHLGLLLAQACLEDARKSRSRSAYNKFLFRYGAHLKASVSEARLAPAARLCLAIAAEQVFESLPTASSTQLADIYSI